MLAPGAWARDEPPWNAAREAGARVATACRDAASLLATVLLMPRKLEASKVADTTALGTYGHNRSGSVRPSTPSGLNVISSCGDTPWLCQYVEPRGTTPL